MHIPPIFNFSESIVFWIVFIWSFSLEIQHSGIISGAPFNKQDAGTLRLVNIGSNIALLFGFIASFLPYLIIPHQRVMLNIGTLLLIAGTVFRRYCMRILGKYFTASVTVVADQPVIEKGLYRWIRHPGYLGGFLMFLGIGIALGNWFSIAIFSIAIAIVYSKRVQAEEKALIETLGVPYREYMSRTKRFLPFIW